MDDRKMLPGVMLAVTASMTSRLLPGKALLPLNNTTVLEQVVKRMRTAWVGAEPIVVTTDSPADAPIRYLCACQNIACSASSNDLLEALLVTARQYEATSVVRVPACDPLSDPKMAWASGYFLQDSEMDYATVQQLPIGGVAEALSISTLTELHQQLVDPVLRSNFSSYLLADRDRFDCALLPAPVRLRYPELNLRLGTEEDFWLLKQLFSLTAEDENGVVSLENAIKTVCNDSRLLSQANLGDTLVCRAA